MNNDEIIDKINARHRANPNNFYVDCMKINFHEMLKRQAQEIFKELEELMKQFHEDRLLSYTEWYEIKKKWCKQ